MNVGSHLLGKKLRIADYLIKAVAYHRYYARIKCGEIVDEGLRLLRPDHVLIPHFAYILSE